MVWCRDFNPIFHILHQFYFPHTASQTNLCTDFKSCLRETESAFQNVYLAPFKVLFVCLFVLHEDIYLFYPNMEWWSDSSLEKVGSECSMRVLQLWNSSSLLAFEIRQIHPDPWLGSLGSAQYIIVIHTNIRCSLAARSASPLCEAA